MMFSLCTVVFFTIIVVSLAQPDPEDAARIAAMRRVLDANNAAAHSINSAAALSTKAIQAIDAAMLQANIAVSQVNSAAKQASNAAAQANEALLANALK